jgi:hypothetical protein
MDLAGTGDDVVVRHDKARGIDDKSRAQRSPVMAIRGGRTQRRNAHDRWCSPAHKPGEILGQPLPDGWHANPREADGKHDAGKGVNQSWQPHDRPRKQEQR